MTPSLTFIELNNIERFSKYALNTLINQCEKLEKILINFTPLIEDGDL